LIEFSEKCGFKMFSEDIKILLGDKGQMMNRVIEGKYYLPFYTPCYLSLSELCIVSNGDVYTCIYHFWDGKSGIGKNILIHSLKEIWESYNPFNYNERSVCGNNCTRKVIDINKKMFMDLKSQKFGKYDLINSIKNKKKIPLTKLEIAITNKCTFACDYCTEITLKRATIGKEKLFNLVDEADKLGTELISLTGGEPTVIDYLPELIRYIKDKGILCKVTTNGYGKNLNNEIFIKNMLHAGLDQITISYYSTDSKLYSQVTNRNDAKEKVEAFISKLQQLRISSYDFFWNINIFVDKLNYEELPGKIKFLSQFNGINRVVPVVVKRKKDRFLSRNDIDNYYEKVLPQIECLELETRFPLLYRECRKLFGKSDEEKKRAEQGLYWIVDAKRCYHNFNKLFIANDGNAYHCFVFHIHKGDILGSIYKLSLGKIWEKHQEIIKTMNPSINPICQTHRCNPDISAFNNQIHLQLGNKDV